MAKLKLEEIRSRIKESRSEKETAAATLTQLDFECQEIKSTMETAAKEGNVELFRKLKKELMDRQDEVEVVEAYMNGKVEFVSLDEAKDAWSEYMKSKEKDYGSKVNALRQAQKALAKAWMDLGDSQNELLKAREELADACGKEPMTGYEVEPYPDFPIKSANIEAMHKIDLPARQGYNVLGITTNYLIRIGLMNEEEIERIGQIERLRRYHA